MKRRVVVSVVAACVATFLLALPAPSRAQNVFIKTLGGPAPGEVVYGLRGCRVGNDFAVTGYRTTPTIPGASQMVIYRADGRGDSLWSTILDFPAFAFEFGNAVLGAANGDVVVAGYALTPAVTFNVVVARFSPAGVLISANVLPWGAPPIPAWPGYGLAPADFGLSIAEALDGGIVVAGMSAGAPGEALLRVTKVLPGGAIDWSFTIGGGLPGNDAAYSVTRTADGGFVVTGFTESYAVAGRDLIVMRLTPAGLVSWTSTLDFGPLNFEGRSVIETGAGAIVVAGFTQDPAAPSVPDSRQMFLASFTPAGVLSWCNLVGAPGAEDFGHSVTETAGGGLALSGYTMRAGLGFQGALATFNAGGVLQWARTFGGPADEEFRSVMSDGGGRLVVAGRTASFGVGGDDFLLGAVDETGFGCSVVEDTFVVGPVAPVVATVAVLVAAAPTPFPPAATTTPPLMGLATVLCDETLAFFNRLSDGGVGGTMVVNDVAGAGAGGVTVGGRQFSPTLPGPSVVRFDAQGSPMWARGYDFMTAQYDFGYAISPLGNDWLVAGSSDLHNPDPGSPATSLAMRLDEDGDVVWALSGEPESEARAIFETQDGGVAVGGSVNADLGGGPKSYGYVTKLTANGVHQWTRLLDPPSDGLYVSSMVEASDGGLAVAGYLKSVGPYLGLALAKLDDSGNYLWSTQVTDLPGNIVSGRAALAAMGDGFVVATSVPRPGSFTLLILAFDADGVLQWTVEFDETPNSGFDPVTVGVAADAEGIFACGSTPPGAFVARLTTGGAVEWTRQVLNIENLGFGASAIAMIGGGALMAGTVVDPGVTDALLTRLDTGGEICLSTLGTLVVTNPAMIESDPGISTVAIVPTWTSQSPAVTDLSMTVSATCDDYPPVAPSDFTVDYVPDGAFDPAASAVSVARAAPSRALGETPGNATLSWSPSTEPDFAEYRIHRSAVPDFTPDVTNLIATQPGTGYTDLNVWQRYYRLGVVDQGGNITYTPAMAPPGGVTDVPDQPKVGSLWLTAPSPARGQAKLRWGLTRAGRVKLAVHDVGGRRVRVLLDAMLPAGEHAVDWDGRDRSGRLLPSGIYFIQLVSDEGTIGQRIVALH